MKTSGKIVANQLKLHGGGLRRFILLCILCTLSLNESPLPESQRQIAVRCGTDLPVHLGHAVNSSQVAMALADVRSNNCSGNADRNSQVIVSVRTICWSVCLRQLEGCKGHSDKGHGEVPESEANLM